jgi:PD-(D/E)XK nuclease superfamily
MHAQAAETLGAAQERTLAQLIGRGEPAGLAPDLSVRLQGELEDGLIAAGVDPEGDPVWLGKHRLNDRDRCEGLLHAVMAEERAPFQHSARTAAGALFHAAIEIDVATERELDPRSLSERGATRLSEGDAAFGAYWEGLDVVDRATLVAAAGRHLVLFRDSFPPILRQWAPQSELNVRARLLKGRVVLAGTPDLVLGTRRRLVIDFKSGRAWPEHAEDMRFYALLLLLRSGIAPYRVATFFLDSGEWQAEDVTEETLRHASGRVVRTAAAAANGQARLEPTLNPGLHCGRCPRRSTCPAVAQPDHSP